LVLRERKWAWQMSAVAAAAALPYLFYLVFDDWESTRFLLPTILIVLILAADATALLLRRWRPPFDPSTGSGSSRAESRDDKLRAPRASRASRGAALAGPALLVIALVCA